MGGGAASWPELRQELRLYPGPRGRGGEPSWTLHDPAAQRFFRLGWLEVEILNRWRLGSAAGIAQAVTRETVLAPAPAAVEAVKNFAVANNLIVAADAAGVDRLAGQFRRRRTSLLAAAAKNYLFIRIPLVRPDAFLEKNMGAAAWLFSRWTALAAAALAILGFYLISRQWTGFRDSFASLLTFRGGLLALAAVGVTKTFHELGHAFACKSLGLRVPSMGISLMCFAPVLWTDTTEAWKLVNRRDRLFIGVSGVYVELLAAVAAALLWLVLPPGPMRTAAFLTAGSAWILTLAVNINPCMRYDGYYLLSDYWNIADLQSRSFAQAKWWLRERLFGLGLPAPEAFSPWDRGKLIVYAFCTWVYRFFLFLGIALLVYHLFFKALGAVLMLVELVFFIAMPVAAEVARWFGLRKHFKMNYRLLRTIALFAALCLFLAYPWHDRVDGAGLLFAERQALFFAPAGGIVDAVAATGGKRVAQGEVLFRLRSPDLDARIDLATRKVALQRLKLSMTSLDAALRAEMATEWDELERLAEDLGGMLAQRADMEIRAPFAGVAHDIPAWLTPGSWVEAKERLGILAGGGGMVAAFVSEADWNRIRVGNTGRMYLSGVGWEPLDIRVAAVDSQAVTEVAYPELASVFGGPLAVHRDAQGKLVPEHAVYRVLCRVDGKKIPGYCIAGQVSLEATPRSILSSVWTNFLGLLVRESTW